MLFLTSSVTSIHGSQLYLPLAHIASIFTSARHHHLRHRHPLPEKSSSVESFKEASKSLACSIEDGFITKHHVDYVLNLKIPAPLRKSVECPWRTRHTSGWSFEENKREQVLYGGSYAFLLKNIKEPTYISRRTFKSNRVVAEEIAGRTTGLNGRHQAEPNLRDKFFVLKTQATKIGKDEDANEKLKRMIEESGTKEEQQRLKVAFAEGYTAASPKDRTPKKLRIFHIFKDVLGVFVIILILYALVGEMSGGPFRRVLIGGGNEVAPEEIEVTFSDVKGVEEAKQELKEVVDFLQNPEKFSKLGGKLPKGVLLVGPAGTGKTLLARAVAGEAGVPFYHAAGPEFDEILVGQGARRVRDLFSAAKLKAPCVIFIDEIDSVGAKRTTSVLHPYANQTINQLLTEMDGFRQNEGIVVLGATNRRDDLDKALLRPGRFDVEVQVPVPDLNGRKDIFELYLGKVKVGKDVEPEILAKRTTGFTGADIESMVNQAAIRAAIEGAKTVNMKHLENARDKVIMGPERKSRIPSKEDNEITAYHEGGHALVAYYTKEATPVHKVTIVSRGSSLGHTAYIPDKESYHVTRAQMEAMLDSALGGRAAEELVFGPSKVTGGASSDLQRATEIAASMVKHLGMSEKVGLRCFDEQKDSLFVVNDLSPNTAEAIDSEIKRILQESFDRAKNILRTHSKELRMVAEALLKYETLDIEDIRDILDGKIPKQASSKK